MRHRKPDAVSYNKGCYIGQEVINRIHSFGHVNRELRGLRLRGDLKSLPQRGDKLFHDGKEIGYITSAVKSPVLNAETSRSATSAAKRIKSEPNWCCERRRAKVRRKLWSCRFNRNADSLSACFCNHHFNLRIS